MRISQKNTRKIHEIMCITRRTKRSKHKEHKKAKRSKRVYPEPPPPKFSLEERLQCHECKECFELSPVEGLGIQMCCAGCHKFFHCGIAGTCRGPQCSAQTSIGIAHQLAWCIHCVPKIAMNREKNTRDERCLCQECFKDPRTYL